MTVPDPTAPTAEDVIAEAIHRADCGCTMWHPKDPGDPTYDRYAAAVVAAVRAMSVETLAELIGGEVQRSGRTHLGASGLFEHEPVARLVCPWRAEP